jgi:predicted AAA+ superfamily ATPase
MISDDLAAPDGASVTQHTPQLLRKLSERNHSARNYCMYRRVIEKLTEWKQSKNRKPLLLTGARQVGKTYIANEFGRNHYESYAYFNLEASVELQGVFEGDLEPRRIVKALSAIAGKDIIPEKTLIALDEVQASNRALTSLKYFNEQAPDYHIVATGSLLGIAVNREGFSFPVGNVDRITMQPMDFEEFLLAIGEERLAGMIRESYAESSPLPLHDRALELYRKYLVVGGMPRSVSRYIDNEDYTLVRAEQSSVIDNYIADMAKYASPEETIRIIAAWRSMPGQLAKKNKKFQYSVIKSGAKARNYEYPIHWLETAGVINTATRVTEAKSPLQAYADSSYFKAYVADTGLLCSMLSVTPLVVEVGVGDYDRFRGTLAENYTLQALMANGFSPYTWVSEGKAEIDFVIQDCRGRVIPVEVKADDNTRSKSLARFAELFRPEYSIRLSAKSFGFANGIRSVPLYAAFCIGGARDPSLK